MMTNIKFAVKIFIYLILLLVLLYGFVAIKSSSTDQWDKLNKTQIKEEDFEDEIKELHNLLIAKTNSSYKNCLNSSNDHSSYARWHNRIRPGYCSKDITDLFLIRSSIFRNSLRQVQRSTWAQDVNVRDDDNEKIKSKRIFVLGSPANGFISPLLDEESKMHQDILLGNFEDTFQSITKKVFIGMKFIKHYCSSVKRIYVCDDDAIVFPWNLYMKMKKLPSDFRHFGGYVYEDKKPVRDTTSRWYVSDKDYKCDSYPPFPSGTMFFLSYDAMVTMYSLAHNYWLLYLDDVFFSIMAELGNIPLTRFQGISMDCGSLLRPHSLNQQTNIVACHGADFYNDQKIIWTELCHRVVSSENVKRINSAYCMNTLKL